MRLGVILGLLAAVSGCRSAEELAADGAARVRVGMTQVEVLREVGEPQTREIPPAGAGGETWRYVYTASTVQAKDGGWSSEYSAGSGKSGASDGPDSSIHADRAAFLVAFDREKRTVTRVARVAP